MTDLGSTNKTRVNGKVVERRVLGHGDVIQVGTTEIHFEDPDEERQLQDAGAQGVCYLEWASKERKGEKVWLRQPRVTFGRRESSTVVLDDRMASGHHAEIVKDLNGYTLRDLGSTNGTLVNGDPTSEVALTHGARIRIGNSRFMFKDPSMKDIEVEFAQFDDDDGWGMMGDIDLSRSRGGSVGLILSLLLLLGAIGGGIWLMQQDKGESEASVDTANLIEDGSFAEEDAAYWAEDGDGELARLEVSPGKGLTITHGGEAGTYSLVRYAEEFKGVSTAPYQLTGNVRLSGDAELVALWSNTAGEAAGLASVTRSLPIPVRGGRVEADLVKPVWADAMSLAVRVGSGGRATLKSLRLVLPDGTGLAQLAKIDTPGNPEATVNPTDGGLDLTQGLAPYFLGASPTARMQAGGPLLTKFSVEDVSQSSGTVRVKGTLADAEGENEHAASVTWSRDGAEGLAAVVHVAGAKAVGLSVSFSEDDLASGLRILTDSGPKVVAAAPDAKAEGARKVLAGANDTNGMRMVTFSLAAADDEAPDDEAAAQAPTLDASVAATADAGIAALRVTSAGERVSLRCTTDYGPSLERAQDRLRSIRGLLVERPGEGIRQCRVLAQEFPFNDAVRDEANRLANQRSNQLDTLLVRASDALRRHEIFNSATTLQAAGTEVDALTALFRDEPTDSNYGSRVAALGKRLTEMRGAHVARVSNAGADELGEMAKLLRDAEGYEPMAAMYLRILVNRYGEGVSDPTLEARVAEARKELGVLEASHGAKVPPDPRATQR